ncbi:MAG: hypothetical protein QM483_09950 [Desulfuromusa sp.]
MKQIGEEILGKATELNKDNYDLKTLMSRFTASINDYRENHAIAAGVMEATIGISAIAAGAVLFDPIDFSNKVPELIGSLTGAGVGGAAGGLASSTVGGIGIVMMGTGFGIPAAVVTALGATAGALSGSMAGWFTASIAADTMSLTEVLFRGISGTALVAFGCYMLFLAMKDLWKAGGEFISYIKSLGVTEENVEGDLV